MPLTLNIANESVDLTSGGDLVKFLTSHLPAELSFIGDTNKFSNQTLKDISSTDVSLSFSTNQQLSWDLGTNGNVTFGFSPLASGGVSIQTSGTLFTYTLADDSQTVEVTIPPDTGYVSLTLNVSLGVSAGAGFSSGNFGVSGNASASSTFAIAFRKAFPLTANVITAIVQTFESFTLPFQPSGVSRLKTGDFLDYEYLGSILAGFGVSYGISGNLLGGRSAFEINESFNLSNLAQAVVNVKPNFQAAASFAFAYDHEDVFHVIVSRQANVATLVYLRSDSNTVTTTETLGITLNLGATFNLSSQLPATITQITTAAFSGVAGALGASAASGLSNLFSGGASGEVQKYIDDVNTKVNALLSKADGKTIQLQLQQQRLDSSTALFSFEFDLTQPDALSKGYPLAIAGDFVDAIQVRGVELDPGSYVENLWTKTSSVSFQFFDLFKSADVTQYFRDVKLVYAGNNQFRLIAKVGVDNTLTINSAQNDCEVYFIAAAPANGRAIVAGDLDVSLNFAMVDHTSKAAQETKRALSFIGGPSLQPALAAIPDKLAGALTVNVRFSEDAFTRFACDEYNGNRPSNLPHPLDTQNYITFIAAVNGIVPQNTIDQDFLRFFASYDAWVEFNRVKIDREGSTITPDRKQQGNLAVNVWPDALDNVDESERALLQCYIYAAQDFMNLCESLSHLGKSLMTTTFDTDFDLLVKSLTDIIRQNITVFFIKPTLAALFRLSLSSTANVQLTQSGKDITIAFEANTSVAARRLVMAA